MRRRASTARSSRAPLRSSAAWAASTLLARRRRGRRRATAARSTAAALQPGDAPGRRRDSGAYVRRPDHRADAVLPATPTPAGCPASVEKLYTTSTALLRFGPHGARLSTTRCSAIGSLDADGTWHGTLYLRGGGDPTFGSAGFDRSTTAPARRCSGWSRNLSARPGSRASTGRIVGDESLLRLAARHAGHRLPASPRRRGRAERAGLRPRLRRPARHRASSRIRRCSPPSSSSARCAAAGVKVPERHPVGHRQHARRGATLLAIGALAARSPR